MSTQGQKRTGKNRTAGKSNTGSSRRPGDNRRQQSDRISSRGRRRAREAQKKRRIRLVIMGVIVGLLVCVLAFSIYKLASIFLVYNSAEKEYEDLKQYVTEDPISPDLLADSGAVLDAPEGQEEANAPLVPMTRIDLDSLQEINPDAVGWIEIPDTVISYPLLHSEDNLYYLRRTFQKENNRAGSIFIESKNHSDLSDLHTIIYGHNMKNGSMFADLKNYLKKDFWQEHPYVYIDLVDGAHCYQIFSCHEAPVSDVCYTIGYEADNVYADFLTTLQSASLFDTGVSVEKEDHIVTLSTCTNDGKDRIVVHAKKIY